MRHNKETTNGLSAGSLIHFEQFRHPSTEEEHLDVFLRNGERSNLFIGGAVQRHDPDGMPWISSTDSLSDLYQLYPDSFDDVKEQILQHERLLIQREIEYRQQIGRAVPRMLTSRLKELDTESRSASEKETALQQIRKSKSNEQSRTR